MPNNSKNVLVIYGDNVDETDRQYRQAWFIKECGTQNVEFANFKGGKIIFENDNTIHHPERIVLMGHGKYHREFYNAGNLSDSDALVSALQKAEVLGHVRQVQLAMCFSGSSYVDGEPRAGNDKSVCGARCVV